jgi:hypothetical protein
VSIAVEAGESEVSAVVASAMLASDDVLDVIAEERLSVLRQAAVFASMTGAVRGQFAGTARTSCLRRHGLQPRAGEISLAEWRQNSRHGLVPRNRRAPLA